MKRRILFIFILIILFGMAGCGETPPSSTSYTIFIYMCGSNLETKQGLAGKDIDELLAADIPDNVNVVLETGGAKKWRSHGIANDKIQRYIVKDHELKLVEELENANMGSPKVLGESLEWAAEHYLSDRNVLIIWDHGGDATEGVCYDENYGFHGINQSDLSATFREWGLSKETIQDNYPKIDMIIFDTCFMGNIETVAWLKDYFSYMIASETIMPGNGLDYKVIAEEFAKNDIESYGRAICDAFQAECERTGEAEKTELSLYDLSQADECIRTLEDIFEKEIEERKRTLTPEELRALSYEGMTSSYAKRDSVVENSVEFNLIDLRNLIKDECTDPESLERADQAFEKLICYQVGEVIDTALPEEDKDYGKARCTGVSMYYPFQFDQSELERYIEICPIKNYAALLKKFFLDQKMQLDFADSGSITADGRFEITLTDESKPYLNYLIAKLWKQGEDGESYYLLGEITFFFPEEEKSLTFRDRFYGSWYHLNGSPLTGKGYWDKGKTLFHARIGCNGEETIYNFLSLDELDNKPKCSPGYIGSQYDEEGLVNRIYRPLIKGDVVTVLSNDPEAEKAVFTVNTLDLKPEFQMLEPGPYRLQFTVVALDGSGIASDYAVFEVTEDGAQAVYTIEANN